MIKEEEEERETYISVCGRRADSEKEREVRESVCV